MEKKRIAYLEIMRVISCLLVITIHTTGYYVTKSVGDTSFWFTNIIDSLSRCAVPLFVMISGALLLDKDYKYSKEKIINHIMKLIVFFIFWSVIYALVFNILTPVFIKHESISIMKILSSLVNGYYHMWFIYMIIGLYLLVPLLRLWVCDKNKKYVEYFLILSIIFTFFLPTILNVGACYSNIFVKLKEILDTKLMLTYVGGYTTYFILGWYLNNYVIKNNKLLYFLGFISLVVTVIGAYFLMVKVNNPKIIYDYLTINVLLYSISIFVFIKNKYISKKNNNKLITSISKYSLGIYAIHAGVIKIVLLLLERVGFNHVIINIFIIWIVAFTVSYIASIIMSKIPLLKNVI